MKYSYSIAQSRRPACGGFHSLQKQRRGHCRLRRLLGRFTKQWRESGKTSFSLLWTSSRTNWQVPTSRRTRRPWRRKYPTSWISAPLRRTSTCSGSAVFSTSILRALLPMLLSISPLAGSRGSTTKARLYGARATAIQMTIASS